jgi:hypothetical protein
MSPPVFATSLRIDITLRALSWLILSCEYFSETGRLLEILVFMVVLCDRIYGLD